MTLPVVAASSVGHIAHHNALHVRYNAGILVSGTFAGQPLATAVPPGTLYWATDTATLYYSDGVTWLALALDHGGVTGLGDDDHPQYLLAASHNAAAHGAAVIPTAVPGPSAVGDVAAEGVAASYARSDHVHGREAIETISYCRVIRNSEEINVVTGQVVTWQTEVFDVGGFWVSGAPSKITIPAGMGGTYLITCQTTINLSVAGDEASVIIRKNGATKLFEAPTISSDMIGNMAVDGTAPLAAGDYIEAVIEHDIGLGANVGREDSYFTVLRLGA